MNALRMRKRHWLIFENRGVCREVDPNIMFDQYKGVRVGVIKTNGKIATAFPDTGRAALPPSPRGFGVASQRAWRGNGSAASIA